MLLNFDKITADNIKNINIDYNLHSHNYLCKHAIGSVEDYVSCAVNDKMKLLGISDHIATFGWKTEKYGIDTYGANVNNIDDIYLPQFETANDKFGNKITVLKGGEVEYFNESLEAYKILKDKLDYLILGQHCVNIDGRLVWASGLGDCEDFAIKLIEAEGKGIDSGLFSILAHPDMVFGWYTGRRDKLNKLFEQLIFKAVSNNVLIEVNANGIRCNGFGYPTDLLIDICKYNNIPVIVSSDCHRPDVIVDDYIKKLYFYLMERGIKILSLNEVLSNFKKPI